MTYFLALARSKYEFKAADAINDMGELATVPRKVEFLWEPPNPVTGARKPILNKDGSHKWEYRPFLPGMIFCAISEEAWYKITRKRLFCDGTILPPVRRDMTILPRTWGDFQGFAQRAEAACNLRIEQYEAGRKVARYRKGDVIRIMGHDLLTGELSERLARVTKISAMGVEVDDGSQMMGKTITRVIEPTQILGMAAE